ncbi:MAG TPA: deoxyguanosinetriphosphate triphosphohydrolase [Thermoflexales bacterium]|nr:deoxyguanosinetriphosphate triphosphohydrolase [Thermoflexales bacterium]HQW34648.1 deoxyguanosinetriphosphate triphosphohydrolase [Thermoflexales bacterium]
MRTREQLEQIERMALQPYAALSAESRGRFYPEGEAAYRTAFQRDRERVLHTTAFRRLQGKTQVFVVTEGDYYRTRITHTMEVAQIGRTIARALGVNEDLVEGVCLAHDLGHPPFGHSGEGTLNELMKDHGGFDHNHRSFRIVTEIERRYPDYPGLNLTFELREGIVKHETEYDSVNPAYARDATDYELSKRGSIECQIASFADELAYNAHDLDDGLRAGLLDIREVRELHWWQRASQSAGIPLNEPFTELVRHRVIRRLIGEMVTDVVRETNRRIEASGVKTIDDVRASKDWMVAFPSQDEQMNKEHKKFLFQNMYMHPRVLRMHTKSSRVLEDLWKAYLDEPRILPKEVQGNIQSQGVYRVVCDYIAGMTDRYALDEHARLYDPHERV